MTRKESGALFIVIALVLLTGPEWASLFMDSSSRLSATAARAMAVLYLLPGVGVIFLLLGIYRLASKDKSQP